MGYFVEDVKEGSTAHEEVAETSAGPVGNEESAVRDGTARGGEDL